MCCTAHFIALRISNMSYLLRKDAAIWPYEYTHIEMCGYSLRPFL